MNALAVTTADDFDEALGIAETALSLMAAHGVAPTPRNYAVWYGHASSRMPPLSRAIAELTATGQPISQAHNDELFVRFVVEETQTSALQQNAKKLQNAVTRVMEQLDQASGSTKTYGERLDAASAGFERSGGAAQLREMLDGLIAETRRIAEENQALERSLMRSSEEIAELRHNLAVVQHEAMTDALTGIPNRKFFETQLAEAVRKSGESGEPLCVMMVDIDRFKKFNDRWGHQFGDQVLRLVARTLTDSVKGRDVTARYGGEEFAILLERTRLSDAVRVADQIRASMMRRMIVRKDTGVDLGAVTVSVGVSLYRPGESMDEFVARADAALYVAKRAGRNRVIAEDGL